MIDRRQFLNTLSASALLAATSDRTTSPADQPEGTARARISLNGEWEHCVAGSFYSTVSIPSSRRPSGFYNLNRHFTLPRLAHDERSFVHFEAVTYWGQVSINGQKLGHLDPYVPHEFEFTHVAHDGPNHIDVLIADLVPFADGTGRAQIDFGIHSGFEAYGGIIRDVWVELRPASFVHNVRLAYD